MRNKVYRLRYTKRFEREFTEAINYISFHFCDPFAADRLRQAVENAVLNRLFCPESFQKVPTRKNVRHPYYRIYVNNYVIYYAVHGNIMELRRFKHGSQDYNLFL